MGRRRRGSHKDPSSREATRRNRIRDAGSVQLFALCRKRELWMCGWSGINAGRMDLQGAERQINTRGTGHSMVYVML